MLMLLAVRGSDVLEKEVRPIDASRNSEAIHGREELILPSKWLLILPSKWLERAQS